MTLAIKYLERTDIQTLVRAFKKAHWSKSSALFENYYQETQLEKRIVWLAVLKEEIAGYVSVQWRSLYQPFAQENIPEIMDLNVLPQYRRCGIGNTLLSIAEKMAFKKSPQVGLGVGLYAGPDGGYGAAQRLYIRRGYIPNGLGVTHHYEPIIPGQSYPIDDDLILWLTKTGAC